MNYLNSIVHHSFPLYFPRLDERKGINIGKTYVNRKQARVFIKHIAAVQREALQSKLSETQYVAVLSDPSGPGTRDSVFKNL